MRHVGSNPSTTRSGRKCYLFLRYKPLVLRISRSLYIDRLALAISRFSVLAAELAEVVREIDVNPLVCGAEIAAVDALFVNA